MICELANRHVGYDYKERSIKTFLCKLYLHNLLNLSRSQKGIFKNTRPVKIHEPSHLRSLIRIFTERILESQGC